MITRTTPLGPNVKRLLIERMSQLQVEEAKSRFGNAGVGEIATLLLEDGPDGLKGIAARRRVLAEAQRG